MSNINGLLDRAKSAIAAGESSLRKAADLIAQAQAARATQKQICKRLGKSRAWITCLLAWRKGGYRGGAFDRSNRARVSSRTRQLDKRARKMPARMTPEEARAMEARAEAVARLFPPPIKTIPNESRAALIAALEAYAPPLLEAARQRLNLTWNDLIIPAATEHENDSTPAVATAQRPLRLASAA